MAGLDLSLLEGEYSVCRLKSTDALPSWATQGDFYSISGSKEELSVVCESHLVPEDVKVERNWNALKVAGPLDFSLTGILDALANPLAREGISIFAISTFDTDYLLVRGDDLDRAVKVLALAGHRCSN